MHWYERVHTLKKNEIEVRKEKEFGCPVPEVCVRDHPEPGSTKPENVSLGHRSLGGFVRYLKKSASDSK